MSLAANVSPLAFRGAATPPGTHVGAKCRVSGTEQLLIEGGDARITLGLDHRNQYGCTSRPDPGLALLGSSTASVISEAGFGAAQKLRQTIRFAADSTPLAKIYAEGMDRTREQLLDLCNLTDLPGVDLIFAASGTDIHLIASQLAGASPSQPLRAVAVSAEETGSGVAAALAGRHVSSRTALGEASIEGASIRGARPVEVVAVPVRLPDGSARSEDSINAEFLLRVEQGIAAGQHVLLIVVDVSKSGLIAPDPGMAFAIQRQFADSVTVMVDASQFRMSAATLRAYLERGAMVAITGSKFVGGPTFSGALLVPGAVGQRLRHSAPRSALRAYSSRADWPRDWEVADNLEQTANLGLLLRWGAAIEEMRAFRSLPVTAVSAFLGAFEQAVRSRLQCDPCFEPLQVPALDRSPLLLAPSWDTIPTIFPFRLYGPDSTGKRVPVDRERTAAVYRQLQLALGASDGDAPDVARMRFQLGQPVRCGRRDGVPSSALRLCASSGLVVEAAANGGRGAASVIGIAMAALDKAAWLLKKHAFAN